GRQPGEDARGLRGDRRRGGSGRGRGRGVSGRPELRRGTFASAEPLVVAVGGERRPAWADEALLGEMREGDEVVVNVAALDLGLSSGGFDVVHVNLSRGLEGGGGPDGDNVINLNSPPPQSPVAPVEAREPASGTGKRSPDAAETGAP